MNHHRTRKSGCTGPLILFAVLLTLAYVTTHPTFLSSLAGMTTSKGPLTIVWSTPTIDTHTTRAHVIPTATPAPPHATPTARPVKRSETPGPVSDSASWGNITLLMSGLLLFLAVFAGVWVRVVAVPLRKTRSRRRL